MCDKCGCVQPRLHFFGHGKVEGVLKNEKITITNIDTSALNEKTYVYVCKKCMNKGK
jgi:hypothetical protein